MFLFRIQKGTLYVRALIPVQKCSVLIIRSIKFIMSGKNISERHNPISILDHIQRFCKKLQPKNRDDTLTLNNHNLYTDASLCFFLSTIPIWNMFDHFSRTIISQFTINLLKNISVANKLNTPPTWTKIAFALIRKFDSMTSTSYKL